MPCSGSPTSATVVGVYVATALWLSFSLIAPDLSAGEPDERRDSPARSTDNEATEETSTDDATTAETKGDDSDDASGESSSGGSNSGAASLDDGTLDVLIVGDSLGDGLFLGLRSRLHERDDVELHRHSRAATGLVRLDYYDWLDEIEGICSEGTYDAAVVIFGANDRQMIRTDGGNRVQFFTDEWQKTYSERIDAFTSRLKREVDAVYWVGMPVMEPDDYSRALRKLNGLYRKRADANDIHYVSVWNHTTGSEGDFTEYLDVGDSRRRIRLDDGVHFTTYGYRYLVSPLTTRLRERFELEEGGDEHASR